VARRLVEWGCSNVMRRSVALHDGGALPGRPQRRPPPRLAAQGAHDASRKPTSSEATERERLRQTRRASARVLMAPAKIEGTVHLGTRVRQRGSGIVFHGFSGIAIAAPGVTRVMTDHIVSLNQNIAFTGTSALTGSQGAFFRLGGTEVSYSHLGGPLQIELSGFTFSFPLGPSKMGLDLVVQVDRTDLGSFQRFTPETRDDPLLLRFAWVAPALQPGMRLIGFTARAVLFGGPPAAIQLLGNATLRLTAQPSLLSFSLPGPLSVDAGQSIDVTVSLAEPAPMDLSVELTTRQGFVLPLPRSTVIRAGAQTSPAITLIGVIAGTDFVTATASGSESGALAVRVRPVLTSLDPSSGQAGRLVALAGLGFWRDSSAIWGHSTIGATQFSSVAGLGGAVPQFNPGPVSVGVEVNGQSSQDLTFQVQPRVRCNFAQLTLDEQRRYVSAVVAADQRFFPGGVISYWDLQDWIHQATHVHRGPAFLPWHRELCNRYERLLQEIDPDVNLHYWDWTTDPRRSPNGAGGASDFSLPELMGTMRGTVAGALGAVHNNGVLAGSRDETRRPQDPPQSLTRALGNWPPIGIPKDSSLVSTGNDLPREQQFQAFRTGLETIHNSVHLAFGGDTNIGDPTAHKTFQDPFVFLLHANVDRLFAMWQCQPGQEWRRDPQLVYGNESNDVALTETLAPWDGTRRVHPWTAEGGQIDARNSRHPLIVSPPRYDSIPE